MKALVFDISADFAYFRIPEGTRSNYSFPFPPKTALMGLIASILGFQRNKYWKDERFLSLKFGVKIVQSSINYGIKMNFWRSKTLSTIGGRKIDLKFLLGGSDTKDRGFTTQVKFEYLTDVKFRIYLTGENDIQQEIKERLNRHEYYYSPYLGHANLLAELSFISEVDLQENDVGDFETIVPNRAISKDDNYSEFIGIGGFQMYSGVPMRYRVEENHIADHYETYISIPEEYESIFVPNVDNSIHVKLNTGYGYTTNIDGKKVDICLF